MSVRPSRSGAGRFRLRQPVAILAAVVLGVAAQPVLANTANAATSTATVDSQVLKDLASKGTTSFMVYLREKAKFDGAAKLKDSDAKAASVYQQLTGTATRTQTGVRDVLDAKKAKYTSYWIANALRVDGDKALVDMLAARTEVERIEPIHTYKLVEPTPSKTTAKIAAGPEWGLTNIEAPRVWSEFGDRGEGIVVASIDTGVQYDHPALVGKYRGNNGDGTFEHNYNWYDPGNVCPSDVPCDTVGHGTHTMGTMIGDDGAGNQTGVAPGAKWISAKACEPFPIGCPETSLLAAGQWILAPTDVNGQNPRPDLHPDVVNNSWGGGQGDDWYDQTINAWRNAGIFPSFSAGNSGELGCGSANSPGDSPSAYAAGAYDSNNNLAVFSSRGPAVNGQTKPNLAAPGVNVRSSLPGNGYGGMDGTSMAAPHVSGTVALIWSAAPALRGDVASTEALLDDTATDVDALGCGGTLDDNEMFGEGRLNAYQAVNAAPRGPSGDAVGVITNSDTGAPVAGATVAAGARNVTTGTDGHYTLKLSAGEQTLTASAFGYASQTATVTVPEDSTVTKNFELVETPPVTVTGKVTDGSGHGWPLYAEIQVAGRPGGPIFTDPTTGKYSFTVPGNSTYKLTTKARYPGYQAVTTDLNLGTADTTANVAVPVEPACTVAGYSSEVSTPLLAQSFDSTEAPEGWSVVDRTEDGGWSFDDPGKRGNLTGGSGGFAIIDSDHLGNGAEEDTDLRSPVLDLTGAAAPYVRFNSDLWAIGADSADIDVSSDGGETWTNVWHQNSPRRGPVTEEVSLAPLAGKANAQVRFHYSGSFAWWWQIDNVQFVNRTCTPIPGGLVTGFTTDKNTGNAVNGVTVSSADAPEEKGLSAATPDDPNIGDGFYWFFSSLAGKHSLTATRAPYQSLSKDFTVAANGARKVDFVLKAGRLTVAPATIESHQPYGSTRTTTVTVKNTGSAPANVEMLERSGQFDLLSRQGAPLTVQHMKGLSPAATGTRYGSSPAAAGPMADSAWTRIADMPTALFDNAAATLDGKVYSFGGGTNTGTENKAWVYDTATNAWSALPDLPTARAKASAVVSDGKIYLIGGWATNGTPVPTVDVFDPASESWSMVSGASNPAPTAAAGTAVVDGKVYLVGGCLDGNCSPTDSVTVFDPTSGIFSFAAKYPEPIAFSACGGIGTTVYCAGGSAGTASPKTAYSYDPTTDSWSPLPNLPIDLWGAPAAVGGGLLVLAGGVTGNSSGLTNQTLAYDPAAGAWKNLPNVGFPVYRGGLACGVYKVGGAPQPFVGGKESERLGDLGDCDAGGDAPWLSTTPTTFTLAPGASKKVTVTLTATAEAGILQPGTYSAEFGLRTDTPYSVPSVKAEMNVAPPETWGKIQGTITGQTCAGERLPVKATVQLNLGGHGYTLSADGQGHFAYWLPKGKYQVIVARDGWIPQVQRQAVEAGIVSTLDLTLAPISPCDSRVGGI